MKYVVTVGHFVILAYFAFVKPNVRKYELWHNSAKLSPNKQDQRPIAGLQHQIK